MIRYFYLCIYVELNNQTNTVTLEEYDRVLITVWVRTLHSSIQVVWDSRKDFGDALGKPYLQLVLVVRKHFVVLHQT